MTLTFRRRTNRTDPQPHRCTTHEPRHRFALTPRRCIRPTRHDGAHEYNLT